MVGVIRRIIQGTQKQVQLLLKETQNTAQAHVAYTVQELLSYQVPLSPWVPPKLRGRPSKRIRELINQWVT